MYILMIKKNENEIFLCLYLFHIFFEKKRMKI
jgi:hypothetical protein